MPGPRLFAAILAALAGAGCGLGDRCDWRELPATCELYDVDLRYDHGRREIVAIAGYRIVGAPTAVHGGKEIRVPVAPGRDPVRAAEELADHLRDHARMACRWRTSSRGDCAAHQVMVPLPGCPERGVCRLTQLPFDRVDPK